MPLSIRKPSTSVHWMRDVKAYFKRRLFWSDLVAGAVVACAALPLSLAIALASGVPPMAGLIAAVVAGILCAVLGGSPFAVSGPSPAMAALVAAAVARFGGDSLFYIVVIAGLLQLVFGIVGLAPLIRLVPSPVITGFTAGIGAIIVIGQVPRALGLPPADPNHLCDVITHAKELFTQTNPVALAIAVAAMACTAFLPMLSKRIPAALFAILLPTLVVAFTGIQAPLLGALPTEFPTFSFPSSLAAFSWSVLPAAFSIFFVASLESLLSAQALDRMTRSAPHSPSREIVGQGVANVISAGFGALPVSAVIARSALSLQSGAKSRAAAAFHGVFILVAIVLLPKYMAQIPLPALSGILLMLGIRMMSPKPFIGLWKAAKGDLVVALVTFATMAAVGLLEGVPAGIAAALLVALFRLSRLTILTQPPTGRGARRVSLIGPMTFLASTRITALTKELLAAEEKSVVVDCAGLSYVDVSGADVLLRCIDSIRRARKRIAIVGASEHLTKLLHNSHPDAERLLATSEADARDKTGDGHAIHRLLHGVEVYRNRTKADSSPSLSRLAEGQRPHTLLITCSDSRIDPALITSTRPGEVFVVRNVGNIVPEHNPNAANSELAAVQYALEVLKVEEIIVCGHTGCGAVNALVNGIPPSLDAVSNWLQESPPGATAGAALEEAVRLHAVAQKARLLDYPSVRERVENGQLRVHVWLYDLATAEILCWDESKNAFVPSSKSGFCSDE